MTKKIVLTGSVDLITAFVLCEIFFSFFVERFFIRMLMS